MKKPLDGIRVLDLSRLYPGPYCSMILADFGADVLCIEDRRYASEPAMPSVMRNKRHMSLDLSSAGGREVFLRLARDAQRSAPQRGDRSRLGGTPDQMAGAVGTQRPVVNLGAAWR